LGGAFAAYAEGVDAIAANAAAVAVRVPYSFDWLDHDLTLGISFPAAFRNTDFDNDGKVGFTYQNFYFYSLGAQLQIGPWGVGVLADFQTYDLLPAKSAADAQVEETLGKLHAVVGRSFLGGQLAVGGGLRVATFAIDTRQNGVASTDLEMQGFAPEAGVQIRPDYFPWRLGATLRAPVEGRVTASTSPTPSNMLPFIRPAGVNLPWELELGAAIQLGPRPLNPQWMNPRNDEAPERRQIAAARAARRVAQDLELDAICDPGERVERAREFEKQEKFVRRDEDRHFEETKQRLRAERRARYTNWPRERITVLIELLVSGPSADAIGLESYFSGQAALAQTTSVVDFRRSGENVAYSPRLGFEGEPVANWLQTRFGTYIEPSRFSTGQARQHFTFGFDMKLVPWSGFGLFGDQIWRIGGVADLAPRYQSFGVSIGAWH